MHNWAKHSRPAGARSATARAEAQREGVAMLPFGRNDLFHNRCDEVPILLLDCTEAVRERRADCLRRWGHVVAAYSAFSEFPPLLQLPAKAVLIARQELPRKPGIECIRSVQAARPDISAILLASGWSASLAAEVSSRRSVWMRKEPMSDEELHVLVDFSAPL